MTFPETYSLDGKWEFFYSPKALENDPAALPPVSEFTGKMVTPGYWDDHYELFDEEDFFGLTARFNPDYRKPHFPMGKSLTPHAASSFLIGTGYYRKMIAPVLPSDSRAILTVGPAMWGCAVFCNRVFAGACTGYSTPSEYDLTSLLKSGEENELIVAVCNVHDDGGAYARVDGSHSGIPFGARPGQHRGLAAQGFQSERAGIGGGVSLRITGKARIADWCITFADEFPLWHVECENAAGKTLVWLMTDGDQLVDSGAAVCTDGEVTFRSKVPPHLWSDRDPHLCRVSLKLMDGEQVLDSASRLWGARTVRVSGTNLLVNGKPTYFRGVTEHCYFAETCNPHFDYDKYMHDLGVLKRAGFNFIRCHTWCPPEPFYDACDALGFLVQTEIPSVYTFQEAEAIMRLIRHHPCAVIFCEGNEKIIDDAAFSRMDVLVQKLHTLAPGMLFNPQEAMRGIEYDFSASQKVQKEPFPHDPERLARTREFSDVYGSLGNGMFSYNHDDFPGTEEMIRQHEIYQRPCLSHEIGILGGYLDFNLEKRYENTFIGTDFFEAAKENMTKHGVWQNARTYYEKNTLFISSIRKQLVENLRTVRNVTGYDYLGGIDTHWHLIGYPCGIFNEFYEEKYGETIEDVRRYNDETVLLFGAGNRRNFTAGKPFSEKIRISHYGEKAIEEGLLRWDFRYDDKSAASGEFLFRNVVPGTVAEIGTVKFTIPESSRAAMGILRVTAVYNGIVRENHWKIWTFPEAKTELPEDVRLTDRLTEQDLRFLQNGGSLLLTGNFPGTVEKEVFRTCTSGRIQGHCGTVTHPHPIWKDFPEEGFADWQFFPMMTGSCSFVRDEEMPEYQPILELIPSFKRIRMKSLISEYTVGRGRLLICGLRLQESDPAGKWMKHVLIRYLAERNFAPSPAWDPEALGKRLSVGSAIASTGKKMDAGGRPID